MQARTLRLRNRNYLLQQPFEQAGQRDVGEAGDVVGGGEGDVEVVVVDHRAAGVHHVGHVAVALFFICGDQRFFQVADDFCRILEVQEHGANAIGPHGADAVGQEQPARGRFQGRAAIADLHEFPGIFGHLQEFGGFPEVDDVGVHDIEIFAVHAGAHHVMAVDAPGKQGHAFIAGLCAV